MEDFELDEISEKEAPSGIPLGIVLPSGIPLGIALRKCRDTLFNPLVSSTKAICLPNPFEVVMSTMAMAICRPNSFVPLCGSPSLPDAHCASLWTGNLLAMVPMPMEPLCGAPFLSRAPGTSLLATILLNPGGSSGSGGRAREGRNGGGGNGNQGILGGGVGGGGGQREGIGNERRGNRGSNHGGSNGGGDDDDGNGRGAWVDFIEGEYSLAKILRFLIAEMFATLVSLDIHGLPARARIFRVVSLGFNVAAIVCLWASIRRRCTNPILARILGWIGIFATLLGFISFIALAFSASFAP